MYDLFTGGKRPSSIRVSAQGSAFAYEALMNEIVKLRQYYAERMFFVPSDHLLVRMLNHLVVGGRKDSQGFADSICDIGDRIAGAMGLIHPTSNAVRPSQGVFYNDGVVEVIMMGSEYIDVSTLDSNWQTWEPVTVLSHPFTDLSLDLPNGGYKSNGEFGVAVIYINLPLLALQHRCWRKMNADRPVAEGKVAPRDEHYICQYILPGMLRSQTNCAIVNRTLAMLEGRKTSPYTRAHPCMVIDTSFKMDQVITKYLDNMTSPVTFASMLTNLPMLYNTDALKDSVLPNIPPTRQVKWSLMLSRFPLMLLLLTLFKRSPLYTNASMVMDLAKQIQELEGDKALTTYLPPTGVAMLEKIKSLSAA